MWYLTQETWPSACSLPQHPRVPWQVCGRPWGQLSQRRVQASGKAALCSLETWAVGYYFPVKVTFFPASSFLQGPNLSAKHHATRFLRNDAQDLNKPSPRPSLTFLS